MTENNDLTTSFGIPISDNQNSLTAGSNGPILLQDLYLIEKLAHFNRERIPERVVHAKGAAAHGYFEVTNDVTQWTKAKFLERVGKQTPVFVRFSTVAGEKGSADTVRDPRGFAVKFYTEEGNYDLVGNNTPVFFVRDPMKFPDFIHSQKRNPQTNCKDPNMVWDFLSLTPESTHQATILYSDRGTPKSYRHMNGYGSHTFKWINAQGEAVWIKYHFKTEQGIQNFTREEAIQIAGVDPDYTTRELFEAIAKNEQAAWKVYVQIMTLEDASSYRFNPFDITKVWSRKDYPLTPIGRLVLNRNPDNHFAEVEQVAFSPANVVPGIDFSPDKMLQGRLFAYADAHRYRLGGNYGLLPINCPHARKAINYQRDGLMRFDDNGSSSVNYEPNSFGGPKEAQQYKEPPYSISGDADRTALEHNNDDFTQAGDLYRLMKEEEKARLVDNLVDSLKPAKREFQLRQIPHFYNADLEYGIRVAQGLGIDIEEEVLQTKSVEPKQNINQENRKQNEQVDLTVPAKYW
ncbi:catalase [Nostoc flagelliforme FACHB-838]|uniref:Catalase n=1 Tax=Nostoc flagelliforme FACHB-838 TaxID=2692904 RepID=A0ABR8DV79_9NOSO|nr:catalase [Nostoc flagelliforme]MBD2533058.1 catalase [Nostoc flagelliforme FACHB-838]